MVGDPLGTITNIPQESASPDLLMGSAVATMMSTEICQDAVPGNIYMNTVMTSMGLIDLGTPLMVVNHQMPILEDVTDMGTADIHPK